MVYLGSGTMVLLFYLNATRKSNRQPRRQFDSMLQCSDRVKACAKCCPKELTNTTADNVAKGERTHHCSICRECVQKMDHHCTFLQNCVGLVNHKDFWNLLFHATIVSFNLLIEVFAILLLFYQTKIQLMNTYEKIIFAVVAFNGVFVVIGVLSAVVPLFLFHTRVILKNITTLEDMEFMSKTRYSLGSFYSIKTFFGNYWQAFLPFNKINKYEGFYFPRPGESDECCTVDLTFTKEDDSIFKVNKSYSIEEAMTMLPQGPESSETVYMFNETQFQ